MKRLVNKIKNFSRKEKISPQEKAQSSFTQLSPSSQDSLKEWLKEEELKRTWGENEGYMFSSRKFSNKTSRKIKELVDKGFVYFSDSSKDYSLTDLAYNLKS